MRSSIWTNPSKSSPPDAPSSKAPWRVRWPPSLNRCRNGRTRKRSRRPSCRFPGKGGTRAQIGPLAMSTLKELKLAQKAAAGQNALIGELNGLVKDIERCEKTISDLKVLLERTNNQYTGPRTTRQDVDYLTVLLDCARKK